MLLNTIKNQVKKHFPWAIRNTHIKKYANMVEFNLNAALGRHFLPHPRQVLRVGISGFCNLSCRFCASSKNEIHKTVMPMDLFQDVINQATAMGYSIIELTPIRGEIFMDKSTLKKMQYLDNHPQITEYDFFTNLVVPSEQTIKELFQLGKLKILRVSVYGHDEQSFCDLTRGTKKEYHRLVKNLKTLYELYDPNRSFRLHLEGRTVPSFSFSKKLPPQSELQEIVFNFEEKLGVVYKNIYGYHDFGGQILPEDVKSFGIELANSSNIYKKGVCSIIFRWSSVLEDGRVDVCGCNSGLDDSLVIGDLKKKPLSYILSLNNPLYADIIQEQMEGKFRPICNKCTKYHSIYKGTMARDWVYDLEQVKMLLSK